MNFVIDGKNNLMLAYMLIDIHKSADGNNKQYHNDKIAELKKAIREYNHKTDNTKQIIDDEGIDGYTCKYALPDFIKTIDEGIEYFENHEYIKPHYSYYDCTGAAFTADYKICKQHGKIMVYHTICFDV